MVPNLAGFLAKNGIMEFFPMKPLNFLREVTNNIMDIDIGSSKKRQNSNIKKSLTNKEILSQAILFLAAGYENTSTTLEFLSYNLAKNQHIQDILINEIDSVLEKHVILAS